MRLTLGWLEDAVRYATRLVACHFVPEARLRGQRARPPTVIRQAVRSESGRALKENVSQYCQSMPCLHGVGLLNTVLCPVATFLTPASHLLLESAYVLETISIPG